MPRPTLPRELPNVPALALASVLCAATAVSADTVDERTGPALMIVAPAALAPAAQAWTTRRAAGGWIVTTMLLDPNAPESSDPEALRECLTDWLTAADTVDSIAPAILLLGDVPSSVNCDTAGRRFSGLPTFRFDQPDPRLIDRGAGPDGAIYVSDRPYALPLRSSTPGRAGAPAFSAASADRPIASVGRVPVRSVDEALAVLSKIATYEDDASTGAWRSQLNFVAGEGRFGAGDVVLETLFRQLVGTMIDPAFSITMTYAAPTSIYCPPPSRLEATVRDRFSEPALMAIYLGHGHVAALDRMHWGRRRVPLLTAGAVDALAEASAELPIAFLGCCSSGWYDLPDGRRSLAEAMLLAPGAPAATIAGSRMTHPYGTAAYVRTLTRALTDGRAPTVGELDRRAVVGMFVGDDESRALDLVTTPIARAMGWAVSLPDLRRMHARLFNLIGDPSMRIALPPPAIAVVFDGTMLRAEIPGLVEGVATIEIETRRESNVHEVHGRRLFAPTATELDDLENVAARNYPRANERVLRKLDIRIRDAEVAIPLPDPLPAGAALVRLRIDGVRADGSPVHAIGGLTLPTASSGR